jgi:pseudouridine kinase
LPAFDIIVIGGANLDVRAKAAGSHVAATSNPGVVSFRPGGVGRNIAENLASLDVSVALFTALGRDEAGDMLRQATAASGVDLAMSLTCEAPTGTYVATLDEVGELITAVSAMGIVERISPDHVMAHIRALDAARLIIADCNLRRDVLELLALRFGAKLIVEPVSVPKSAKLAAALTHGRIFLATPNMAQASALTGCAAPEAAAQNLLAQGLKDVIIHLGKGGAFVQEGKTYAIIPSIHAGEISDVTGAGDAAVAGLACGLLRGEPLMRAARMGQAAAALKLAGERLTKERLLAMAAA